MIATTRGALIRSAASSGTEPTLNEYGDEVESEPSAPGAIVAPYDDFPLSIIEVDESQFDQASNQWRSITRLIGRVPANVPVNEGDRIRDNRDGAVYSLDDFKATPRGLSGRSSVTMTLRRTAP